MLDGPLEVVMMKLRRVLGVALNVVSGMYRQTVTLLSLEALVLVCVGIRRFATLSSMTNLQASSALVDEGRISRTAITSLGLLALTTLKLLTTPHHYGYAYSNQ